MNVHHHELSGSRAQVHLVIVRSPAAAGDPRVQGQHGGPVALACHRTHENESILKKHFS